MERNSTKGGFHTSEQIGKGRSREREGEGHEGDERKREEGEREQEDKATTGQGKELTSSINIHYGSST